MSTLITILHIIVCVFLMLTVLLQSGKGGGMGAAFGGGNAATVFGGSGASSFLRRLTAGAGTVFMLTSMLLAFLASHNSADALEKFGEQQEKLAAEKEAAKKKVLDTPGTGSGSAGSASTMIPLTPMEGSGAAAPSDPHGGATGSAVTPAESGQPATKADEKPNPSTPASMSPPSPSDAKKQPAEAPAPAAPAPAATGTKPAETKPAGDKPAEPRPNDRSDRAP
jgi:preprotein translocase subunit SecG